MIDSNPHFRELPDKELLKVNSGQMEFFLVLPRQNNKTQYMSRIITYRDRNIKKDKV